MSLLLLSGAECNAVPCEVHLELFQKNVSYKTYVCCDFLTRFQTAPGSKRHYGVRVKMFFLLFDKGWQSRPGASCAKYILATSIDVTISFEKSLTLYNTLSKYTCTTFIYIQRSIHHPHKWIRSQLSANGKMKKKQSKQVKRRRHQTWT